MKHPIYLDYAATTPMDPRVAKKLNAFLTQEGDFGNPASKTHPYGWKADHAVEQARQEVAELIHATPREIIWTSGATEADNLAIQGVAHFYQARGKHIITMSTEHKAVLDTCQHLEKEGFDVSYLSPESDGRLNLATLKKALREDTILVSIMCVNNETGVMQDIPAIGDIVKKQGAFFHVDGAQGVGKYDVNVDEMQVDLLSISAHKMYGPKGIGALYVRREPRVRLTPIIHGGGHEQGMRSGTLATHQIAAMGEACRIAKETLPEEVARITALRDRLWQGLSEIKGAVLHGTMVHHVSGILNIGFQEVDGDVLVQALPQIAISTGSACTSLSIEPSHVLHAYGVDDALAHSSLRFSIGRFTMEDEIDYAVSLLQEKIPKLVAAS